MLDPKKVRAGRLGGLSGLRRHGLERLRSIGRLGAKVRALSGGYRPLSDTHKQKMSKSRVSSSRCRSTSRANVLKAQVASCGLKRSEELRKRMSSALIGNTRAKGCVRTPETRYKMSLSKIGENNPCYVDGKGYERGSERKILMHQLKYRLWRDTVFRRDNFTCQKCGRSGGRLEVDHIKPWASYPELRYETRNGQTLCRDCHLERHDSHRNKLGRFAPECSRQPSLDFGA